ncbi:MAG: DUF2703 domain-containing protein [Bariatricus sp.]
MAKKWYPVIDYSECAECGICVARCTHGVYDKNKAPVPVVINPDACIDHCHGCGNICPKGAIAYVGDDTGWKPSQGENQTDNFECCCCNERNEKKIVIEYLYLDLKTCDRCIGTDDVLDEVIPVLLPVLEMAGYNVEYKKIEIKTEEMAEQYHFLSSPTIQVNGQDIFPTIVETNCACCGEICGSDVDCRVFEQDGKTYEVPTKAMIIDAILHSFYSPSCCCCGEYKLPDNLKRFFDGKKKKEY